MHEVYIAGFDEEPRLQSLSRMLNWLVKNDPDVLQNKELIKRTVSLAFQKEYSFDQGVPFCALL